MNKSDLIMFLEASINLQKKELQSDNAAWIDGYYKGRVAAIEVVLELVKNMEVV